MSSIQNKYITINNAIISRDVQKPEKSYSAEATLEKLKNLGSFHIEVKKAAQEVYDNFNQTLGMCGRIINWIKSWFGLGEYSYIQKVDRIFSEVMAIETKDLVDLLHTTAFTSDSKAVIDGVLKKNNFEKINELLQQNHEDLNYKIIHNDPEKKGVSKPLLLAIKNAVQDKEIYVLKQELEDANEGLSTAADGFRSIASGLSSGSSYQPGYKRKISNGFH